MHAQHCQEFLLSSKIFLCLRLSIPFETERLALPVDAFTGTELDSNGLGRDVIAFVMIE